MAEWWDLLDQWGNPTGRLIRRGEQLLSGEYHLAVHIWIVDRNNRFLVQRRAEHLSLWPGMWATTGGSAIAGEDSLVAAVRELYEELGLVVNSHQLRLLGRQRRADCFTDIWLLRTDISFDQVTLQAEEVSAVRYVDWGQMRELILAGQFVDYGEEYMRVVRAAVTGRDRQQLVNARS